MLRLWLCALILVASTTAAQEQNNADGPADPDPTEHFDITQLPKGANITLPHPASVVVPLGLTVQVTASDKKQLLKIASIQTSGVPVAFRVAIFDSNQSRVKYVTIHPSSFVVYHFKNLKTIELVPQNINKQPLRATRLLLESNRPLSVSY